MFAYGFWCRLCPSGRHGNTGAKDYSCQTWSGWKVGKNCLSLNYTNDNFTKIINSCTICNFSTVFLLIVRAQIWTALFQWCYSHQNVLRLLCCPHEPYSICSQLWRLTAPCRARGQAEQHYTKDQGQQWHQYKLVLYTFHRVIQV